VQTPFLSLESDRILSDLKGGSVPNIAFRIESIKAERYSFEVVEALGINMQIMLGKPEKGADNTYSYGFLVKVDCLPPIASIDIKGTMFVSPQSKEELEMIEKSAKEGTPPPPLIMAVYSYVLPLAALLSRELGLPPPCPPPQPQQVQAAPPRQPGYHV